MIGSGSFGFSGIIPCLRNMSFLEFDRSVFYITWPDGYRPFGIGIGVVDGNINGHIHLGNRPGRQNLGRRHSRDRQQ